MTDHRLGIELRFYPQPDSQVWLQVLDTVWAWEPTLQPTHAERLSEPEIELPEPWTQALAEDLARRCAAEEFTSWLLFREDREDIGMGVARRRQEVELSLRLARPEEPVLDYFFRLLADLVRVISPPLAMLYDLDSPDAEVLMQGLRGLRDLPPLLYLGPAGVNRVGGPEWVRQTPCSVVDAPGGGVILQMRPSIWQPASMGERVQAEAVKQHLGIASWRPLVLAS